ncbi:MAG TPA: hypothetical protein VGS22_02870 [Thermoanaerobaculia bacterium]|nr:hypothetical protein [Thermoanaerobaculia bacterium]
MRNPIFRVSTSTFLIAVGLGCTVAPTVRAEEALPSPAELERRGAVIGEVTFRLGNIFDLGVPEENRKLFRAANHLHRTTRSHVVEDLLLFRPGDLYSASKIEESERLLRTTHYFYDPEIRAVRFAEGRVDLEIVTRDLWTLKGGVGVGRSGGTNSSHFQIEDTNLLGTGRTLDVEQSSNVDRTSSLLHYRDPNVGHSRVLFDLGYSNNSDGDLKSVQVERPFFSFDSRWAAGLTAVSDDRVDSLYRLGHIFEAFRHKQEKFELYGGLSRERAATPDGVIDKEARAHRFSVGFTFERDRFAPEFDRPVPAVLPPDRTLAYPWVAFDSVGNDYLKTRNFDQLGRAEDLTLGRRFHARLGLSSTAFGADQNEAIFDSTASWGYRPSRHPTQTILLSGTTSGRYGAEGGRNLQTGLRARYYIRNFGDQLFLASLEADATRRLDPENQLLLGGDSGLRGYPLRYQDGDRRILFSLEQRVFTNWYPYRLFHVGGAFFFDAGQVWSNDPTKAAQIQGLLKDIGFGLRLGSSRSSLGSVVHLDLAFPLDGDSSIKRVQYLVTTRTGF